MKTGSKVETVSGYLINGMGGKKGNKQSNTSCDKAHQKKCEEQIENVDGCEKKGDG